MKKKTIYLSPALETTSLLSMCGFLDTTTSFAAPDGYNSDDSNNNFFNDLA